MSKYENVKCLLDDYISSSDLNILTNKYNALDRPIPVNQQFEYAIALTRSRFHGDNMRAINILEDLCVCGDPQAFRDYLYYIAVANIKLKVGSTLKTF